MLLALHGNVYICVTECFHGACFMVLFHHQVGFGSIRVVIEFRLTLVVVIQRPELASAVQRLLEAELKEERSLLQACASNPEGPAAPWRAACIMASASKPIKYDGIDWFMLTIKEGMGALDLCLEGVCLEGDLWLITVHVHHFVWFQEPVPPV